MLGFKLIHLSKLCPWCRSTLIYTTQVLTTVNQIDEISNRPTFCQSWIKFTLIATINIIFKPWWIIRATVWLHNVCNQNDVHNLDRIKKWRCSHWLYQDLSYEYIWYDAMWYQHMYWIWYDTRDAYEHIYYTCTQIKIPPMIYRLSMGCHTVSPAPVWVRILGP